MFSLSGTYRYFKQILSNYGIETSFINTTDTALLEKTVKDNTKVGRERKREREGGKRGREGEKKCE